jgi:TctA family transporter
MSLIIGLGDAMIFLKKPISLTFIVVTVVYLGWSLWREWRGRQASSSTIVEGTSVPGDRV